MVNRRKKILFPADLIRLTPVEYGCDHVGGSSIISFSTALTRLKRWRLIVHIPSTGWWINVISPD